MKNMLLVPVLLVACSLSTAAHAEPFTPGADDTIVKLLTSQTGKVVTLKLGCNEELSGKVKAVSAGVVHLSELSGKEFYDAAVATGSISAVLVRAR
jgi:hypothetical protein